MSEKPKNLSISTGEGSILSVHQNIMRKMSTRLKSARSKSARSKNALSAALRANIELDYCCDPCMELKA
jgi:hypothetical protein